MLRILLFLTRLVISVVGKSSTVLSALENLAIVDLCCNHCGWSFSNKPIKQFTLTIEN